MTKRNRDKRRLAQGKRIKAIMDNPNPKPNQRIEHQSFVTRHLGNGVYRYTLAHETSKFIAEIEDMFGPRDSSFTYVGLEFDETPDARPMNWFPKFGIPSDEKGKRSRHVLIRLGERAIHDPQYALWQLAHECFHLLDPWQKELYGRSTTVLEEGIAASYQDTRVTKFHNIESSYVEAKSLVEPFMPNLVDAVKHIRMQHRVRIGDIDHDILLKHCSGMEFEVAEKLCNPFEG